MIQSIDVVIRFFPQTSRWHIAHAKSYQAAFRSAVNSFKTRSDAVSFARKHNCNVVKHPYDQLQNYTS